jgi:threonine dehydratase
MVAQAESVFGDTIGRDEIVATEAVIRPHIRHTPVVAIDGADIGLSNVSVFLKLELMQHSGSFKVRGAFTNILTRKPRATRVIAASGGNHGAAVAFAAHKLGIAASIFVPSITSPAKMQRIRNYGARLMVGGERYADALAASEAWSARCDGMTIHAFDQRETLLGQGTLALEFDSQVQGLEAVLVSVGGGGMIGGVAAWYGGRTDVIGVEPEAAPTLTRALAAGHPVDAEAGGIAADSLAPRRVGTLMFPIAQRFVRRVVLVTDDDIRHAQKTLWDLVRVVGEPGGVAAFAALLCGRYRPSPGARVGVVICGGNTTDVDFDRNQAKPLKLAHSR